MTSTAFLRSIAVALASAATALFLNACGRHGAAAPPPPPTVTVAPVQQREIVEWDEFTGRTEAVETVEVRPRVSGHVVEVRFQSGQLVKKGDVLFAIDPRWYQAEFDRRQAEIEQAQAQLDNAQRDAKRSARLVASKTISSEDSDTTQSKFAEAKAALESAKAVAATARLDLENTEVRAPIAGRVSRALLTAGNYVSGVAGGASLLTTLVSVDPIYVYADIDESSLLKINAVAQKAGNSDEHKVPVELGLADEEGFPRRGTVESFDNRLDANTGTILLRAEFPNPDGRIVPGLFAHIRVPVSAKHPALFVEENAIGTDQAQKFVLAVGPDHTVEYRKVQLGPEINGQRIVRAGLQAGEKIIVNGLQRARPGAPVTPQDQVAGAPAPEAKTAGR